MLLYDNFDDCKSKLLGTIIYYKGQAVYVKDIQPEPDPTGTFYVDYSLKIAHVDKRGMTDVKLSDPDLNFMEYQLGYANFQGTALYWYRKPVKQYKQGLKAEQLNYKIANPNHVLHEHPFSFNRSVINMLEGRYPSIEGAKDLLKAGAAGVLAFHKDFAFAYNDVFEAYELEYKGVKIGHTADLVNVNLTDKYAYVKEALMEAVA